MKAITLSYAFMLLMSIVAGFILALMCKCSVWWWPLFLFPIAWSLVPLRELRKGARSHSDFSTILFVVSFAVLVVVVVSVTLLMKMETFWSTMCIMSSWVALLLTAWFVSFVPREPNLQGKMKKWVFWKKSVRIWVPTYFYENLFTLFLSLIFSFIDCSALYLL